VSTIVITYLFDRLKQLFIDQLLIWQIWAAGLRFNQLGMSTLLNLINWDNLQWKPLNVITDNVIIRLMWSNWPSFVKSQINLSKVFYRRRRFAYCYHSDNVSTFCLSQSDHINLQSRFLKITSFNGEGCLNKVIILRILSNALFLSS
jgi:hypothetical protein